MPYDPSTPEGQVRLLINDTSSDPVFGDEEIAGFLSLEASNVKLAAAQAVDVIADDEALTSKYIRDHDLATNGPAVADSLRKRSASLRTQAALELEQSDDGGYFEIIAPTDDWWCCL